MKTNALLVLALAASALMTCAQEPRVTHTQFHSGPVSLGLSATVDRFRHSNGPLWLGYAVQALPRTHLSACSSWTGSSEVEAGCCNELRLEDTADNLNTSESPIRLRPSSMCFSGSTTARSRRRAWLPRAAPSMPAECLLNG